MQNRVLRPYHKHQRVVVIPGMSQGTILDSLGQWPKVLYLTQVGPVAGLDPLLSA